MLVRNSYLVAFALFATAARTSIAAPQAAGEVLGRLEDSVTQRPVTGAAVRLLRGPVTESTQKSDAAGRFVFSDVPEDIDLGIRA